MTLGSSSGDATPPRRRTAPGRSPHGPPHGPRTSHGRAAAFPKYEKPEVRRTGHRRAWPDPASQSSDLGAGSTRNQLRRIKKPCSTDPRRDPNSERRLPPECRADPGGRETGPEIRLAEELARPTQRRTRLTIAARGGGPSAPCGARACNGSASLIASMRDAACPPLGRWVPPSAISCRRKQSRSKPPPSPDPRRPPTRHQRRPKQRRAFLGVGVLRIWGLLRQRRRAGAAKKPPKGRPSGSGRATSSFAARVVNLLWRRFSWLASPNRGTTMNAMMICA